MANLPPRSGGERGHANEQRNRAGDLQQLRALQAADFRGPVWDRFADHLAGYGFPVMVAWIQTAQVFNRMQEKSRQLRLKPPSDGRTLTGEVADELALETVSRALGAYRRVLEREGWSAAGGASLLTFFLGQCLFQFPNVYRRWLGETRPPPWQVVQVDDLTEADHRYGQPRGVDPAEQAECRLELEQAERRLCEELDPRIFFVLHKREEGYQIAQIAEMLGATPRVVERLVAKHRQWRQQHGEPEEEGL